jgi:hypothetical protein
MARIDEIVASICDLPILLLESLFAQWCLFTSMMMRKYFKADEEFIQQYRKITLKKTCIGGFNCVVGTVLFVYFIYYASWFFKPHFILSAPVVAVQTTSLNPVIVTIATNGHSAKDLVQRVRSKGQFYGDIYVIGDECSDMEQNSDHIFVQVWFERAHSSPVVVFLFFFIFFLPVLTSYMLFTIFFLICLP